MKAKNSLPFKDARRLSASERAMLADLYANTCEGNSWDSAECDFQPVRIGREIGFDNGFGYIFTTDGNGYIYAESSNRAVKL